MDEITLTLLAAKLLEVCDLHPGNAIYSIISELDRKPAQFHRIFSNTLANHPVIIEAATDILGNEEIKKREFDTLRRKYEAKISSIKERYLNAKKLSLPDARILKNKVYCYRRILEDMEYFIKSLEEIKPFTGEKVLDIKTDKLAAYLSLLSHVYLISYNYPPQPFFPYSAIACQHIEFWRKVDYFDFKLMFSGEDMDRTTQFRKSISQNKKAWSKEVDPNIEEDPVIRNRMKENFGRPFNPYGMIKAMIERCGELAPGINYEAVQRTIRDYLWNLGCRQIVHSDRERWFLINLENEIEKTIIEML
jgi:hypothetical protein